MALATPNTTARTGAPKLSRKLLAGISASLTLTVGIGATLLATSGDHKPTAVETFVILRAHQDGHGQVSVTCDPTRTVGDQRHFACTVTTADGASYVFHARENSYGDVHSDEPQDSQFSF